MLTKNQEENLRNLPRYEDVADEEQKWTGFDIGRLWDEGQWPDDIVAELRVSLPTVLKYLKNLNRAGKLKRPYDKVPGVHYGNWRDKY